MPLKEAVFWFSVTVFGTGLFFWVEGDPKRVAWAVALVILGIAGMAYSVYAHHHPGAARIPLWIGMLVVTWLFLGYDLYDRRHPQPHAEALVTHFVKGWGAPGGSRRCNELFDGSQLLPWSTKYNIAVVCGMEDPTIDKFENTSVTVSRAFSIHPGDINISVPYSDGMLSVENRLIEETRKTLPPGTPKGTLFAVESRQWYEPILLPKNAEASDVRKLSDVPKLGGAIISQGWPKQ